MTTIAGSARFRNRNRFHSPKTIFGSNLTKKILGGWVAVFGCFAGVFEGGFWKMVCLLMVICW